MKKLNALLFLAMLSLIAISFCRCNSNPDKGGDCPDGNCNGFTKTDSTKKDSIAKVDSVRFSRGNDTAFSWECHYSDIEGLDTIRNVKRSVK